MKMASRCRLCAEFKNDLTLIFEDVQLASQIEHLFQLKITPEDQLPTVVCENCRSIVSNTWDFWQKLHKAQEVLLEVELNGRIAEVTCEDTIPLLVDPLSHISDTECVLPPPISPVEKEAPKRILVRKGKSTRMKLRRTLTKSSKKDEEESYLSGTSDLEVEEDGSINVTRKLDNWQEYPWICCFCQLQFLNTDEMRDHQAVTHGRSPRYACADCPKVYTKYNMFVIHARIHRPYLKYCCDTCGKWFRTKKQNDTHRAGHEDERPHGCVTCGKRFRMQSALIIHTRSHLPPDIKNKYQCEICPKKFGTKPNLMAHMRIHAGIRNYTCDQCGKSFVQKGNLENHLLTHTAVRPFKCTICNKAFKTVIRLRKHSSVHTGLKPHQCDVCGRQFRERGTLKEHHRIHTGAMPFTCEYCGKCFRFKGVLTTHRRQHTGERPYSCLECQHHFTNWPNYNKHMKRKHGINTSVTVRKPQSIPPTGKPQKNPPGTVLAPPQPIGIMEHFTDPNPPPPFYPVLNLYNLPEELLQQRI